MLWADLALAKRIWFGQTSQPPFGICELWFLIFGCLSLDSCARFFLARLHCRTILKIPSPRAPCVRFLRRWVLLLPRLPREFHPPNADATRNNCGARESVRETLAARRSIYFSLRHPRLCLRDNALSSLRPPLCWD